MKVPDLHLNITTQNHINAFKEPIDVCTVADLQSRYCNYGCGNIWSTVPSCGVCVEIQPHWLLLKFYFFSIVCVL